MAMKRVEQVPKAEPTPLQLAHAGQALAERLTKEVKVFEDRYELTSERLEDALLRGEIRETAEVAQWLIAYRTLRGLQSERETEAQ